MAAGKGAAASSLNLDLYMEQLKRYEVKTVRIGPLLSRLNVD
jgi:hypothetical protein